MNSSKVGGRSFGRLIRLLAVVLLAALAGPPAPAQSNDASPSGIKNFGKVNDNYCRGSQPDGAGPAALKRQGESPCRNGSIK